MSNWYELPNNELLNYLKDVWYINSSKLIGRYVVKGKNFKGEQLSFFTDIRSNNFSKLLYPENDFNKEIEIIFYPTEGQTFEQDKYYEFYLGIKNIDKRIFKNRLSLFFVDPKNIKQITPKLFIERRQKLYTNISIELADTIRKAIKTLSSDINREPETFIYELLQNADDYKDANRKNVEIRFTLTPNYLLLTHNGQAFNYQNVYALTGISQGDKRDNIDAIGFKGIGFKSIFKDSSFAIIKSGGFEFKFDEASFPKSAKRPWQIIPIWIPSYEDELSTNKYFQNSPVSIAIKPTLGNEKLRESEKSYKNILSKVFKDDRILIFLRWIDKVTITDSLENQYVIELNKNKEKWFISTGLNDIEVDTSISAWMNKQIDNEEITIPEKYYDIKKTKITFAVERIGSKLTGTTNSKIYNYLPTEIDFGFKFLINGDFIPDGSRAELHNNEWNNYLGSLAGNKFVEWLSVLGNHKWLGNKQFDRDFINLLPDFNDPKALNAGRNTFFLDSFKNGFKLATIGHAAWPFIPTQSEKLEILSNILIDETDLADFLKADFFNLTGITEHLIHKEVGKGIEKIRSLIIEYKKGVVYNVEKLKTDLKTPNFQKWLKFPSNNFSIIKHFSSKKELQGLLDTEEVILSESNQLKNSSMLFRSIPDEITFLQSEKINSDVAVLVAEHNISLNLKEFEPVSYFNETVLGKQNIVNQALKDVTNLLNFWRFIFDNWASFESDVKIKDSLRHFEVLCKSHEGNSLLKNPVSSVYLSAEFDQTHEIESVIKDLGIHDAVFISNRYIDPKREAEKWRKIFKQASAITDLQKVIEVLLPKLAMVDNIKHFEIAKQIFKFWKDNQTATTKLTETQIGLIKANLRIRCTDNQFRKTTECFLSDYFNNNQLIASWLPNVELVNQIDQEYGPKKSQVAEWKTFFLLIGCIELADKQNIVNAKLEYLIKSQDLLQERHFDYMKSLSELYKSRRENGINFDIENVLSKIKLLTSENLWHLPTSIHLSNPYKPNLSLQDDESINVKLHFLNGKYLPNEIEKLFLTDIGLNDGFHFKKTITSIHIDKIEESEFVSQLESIPKYRDRIQEIKKSTVKNARGFVERSYSDDKIRSNTKVSNHLLINYPQLIPIPKYCERLLKYIIKDKKIELLSLETELKIWNNNIYRHPNYTLWLIQTNAVLVNQEGNYKKPTELYSYKFCGVISNKAELPEVNYSNELTESGKSLEDILGIKQLLSSKHCIELLSRAKNRITLEQINRLQIVDILSGYIPTTDEKANVMFLNKKLEWKPRSELFISNDERFKIDPTQQLHEEFDRLADNFDILELAEENLVLKTKPETPNRTDEIETFFRKRAKFVAFKIDHLNYRQMESDIIEKVAQFKLYEVAEIAKVFPEGSPIYYLEIDFHLNSHEDKILYVGNWKTNKSVIDFLFNKIGHIKIERLWFENLINRWDDYKIIEKLNEEIGSTPLEWSRSEEPKEGEARDYIKEVRDFIEGMRAVEEIYDSYKIEELKSILADFKNQPDEKKRAFNLLAKLKLCKRLGLNYNKNWEFNKLEEGAHRYFIHSARGSFAYIHPNEILQMRDSNFKMAIDYGMLDIKIYNSHSEIIELYQNYLMLYQGNSGEAEIFRICEENRTKAKFHFLIVDREKQTDNALMILKILNTDSYE